MITSIGELLPVSGNEPTLFTVVVDTGTVVLGPETVIAAATGDSVIALEAGESPTPFTASMVTE
jgi:hypothetical protein